MEFSCSKCNYSSDIRENVVRHINKKIKCGNDPEIIKNNIEICCEFCKKTLKFKSSLVRHLKVCKVKKINLEKELEIEKKKNNELEKKLAVAEALSKKPTTINNNLTINLTAYNNPNLENIEKYLKSSVKKLFLAIPTLVEKIHFNNDIPENHNMCIKNARSKLAKVFNGKKWTTIDEEELLNELVDTYESLLEEHDSKYIDRMNIIKTRDTEEKVYEDLRGEVKKVLYENRKMIKN
jgi:hypothetical protein